MGLFKIYLIIAMCLSSVFAFGGRLSSGGGGNVCYLDLNGRPSTVLLDLISPSGVVLPKNRMGQSLDQEIFQTPRSGVQIDPRKVMNRMELAYVASSDLLTPALRAEVEYHLTKITPSLFRTQLMTALNMFSFIATPRKFVRPSRIHLENTSLCQNSNTTAVFFYWGTYVFVSIPNWNELSLSTQSHLLVHETVRALQEVLQLNDLGLQETSRRILEFQGSSSRPHLRLSDLAGIQTTNGRDFSEALLSLDPMSLLKQDSCTAHQVLHSFERRILRSTQDFVLLQKLCRGQEVVENNTSQAEIYQRITTLASTSLDFVREGSAHYRQIQAVLYNAIGRSATLASSGLADATAPILLFPRDFVATGVQSCAAEMTSGCYRIRELFQTQIEHLSR
jgi:hypothetical protein